MLVFCNQTRINKFNKDQTVRTVGSFSGVIHVEKDMERVTEIAGTAKFDDAADEKAIDLRDLRVDMYAEGETPWALFDDSECPEAEEPMRARVSAKYRLSMFQCPFCGADVETMGATVLPDGTVERRIRCTKCGRSWTDVYVLAKSIMDSTTGSTTDSSTEENVGPSTTSTTEPAVEKTPETERTTK